MTEAFILKRERESRMRERAHAVLLIVLVAGMAAGCSRGATYPNREIEFVIPFAPGGPADTAARMIQPRLSELLGVPVVLINKPGAGGALGADYVAKEAPDGYRVLATTNNVLTVLPSTQKDLTFQPSDFAPIGSYAADLSLIAVRSDKPWKTLEEFVDDAKKNPGKLNYGSAGVGTISFFSMELLKLSYGLDIAHVPFQGTAPAKDALLGGHVDVTASGFGALGPLLQSGDLRALVTTAAARMPKYPDVPTMTEKGFPEASLNIWMGLFVPTATPQETQEKLAQALAETMQDPAVLQAVEQAGYHADYRNAEATRELIESESAMIRNTVQRLGIQN
jgi:tripartite-type tricarboxylate transporter receptor subunit TctC